MSKLLQKLGLTFRTSKPKNYVSGNILTVESLEPRLLLSAAFDLIQLTAMRADPDFADIDGTGVSVAVIDTGLDQNHYLLGPNYLAGADLVYGGSIPTPVGDHGTHVAGIVGATDPDIGVAPDVGLIGLQVFTEIPGLDPGAFNHHVEDALNWVLGNYQEYNILAVNMSLGSGFYTSQTEVSSSIYYDEIQRLEAAGITVVAAAGNSYGWRRDSFTGEWNNNMDPNSASPGILSTLDVGAVWETDEGGAWPWSGYTVDLTTGADRITAFSQRPPLDVGNVLFAPGAMINSTIPGNRFTEMPGTSMASPMVAGVVALMQEAAMKFGGRFLAPAEVRDILLTTADTIYDGDDEDSVVWSDTNGDGQLSADEYLPFDATNLYYQRVNVYEAMKEIRDRFDGIASPNPSGQAGSGDPNGTIPGAYLGPQLRGDSPVDGSLVEARIIGTIGTDGASGPGTGVQVGDKDVDIMRFEVLSPGDITIQTTTRLDDPQDFDTVLRLFDGEGNELAFNDDIELYVDKFSRIQMPLELGVYYVGVSGYDNTDYNPFVAASGISGGMGNYVLEFTLVNDDPNGLISGAVPVNLITDNESKFDGSIGYDYGNLVGVSDVDLFEIYIPDDGTLYIDIDTPYEANYLDSFLRL